jgi:hypothetical protein
LVLETLIETNIRDRDAEPSHETKQFSMFDGGRREAGQKYLPSNRCHVRKPLKDSAWTAVDPHVSQQSEHSTKDDRRIWQAFSVGLHEDLGRVTSSSKTIWKVNDLR